MCSGYRDLTADGLERGAAAGTAEVCWNETRTNYFGLFCHQLTFRQSMLNQCTISRSVLQAIFSIFSQ